VFLLPLALISAIPLAAGLDWIIASIRQPRRSGRLVERLHKHAGTLVGVAVLGILVVSNGPQNNLRNYWFAQDHADNLLACMLPRAMVFPSGDHDTFPLI